MNYIDMMYDQMTGRKPANEPQKLDETLITNDPIQMPSGYKMQVPQSDIILENYNKALLERQNRQDQAVLSQDPIEDEQAGYKSKVLEMLKGAEHKEAPRNDLADIILMAGAPLLGAFTGEAGALVAPSVGDKSRALVEDVRKKEAERAKLASERVAKTGGVYTDLMKGAREELKYAKEKASSLGKEIGEGTMKGSSEIAKMERSKELEAEKKSRAALMSPGNKAADTAFGKDYNEYVLGGGYSKGLSQIAKMKDAIKQVEAPGQVSGYIGMVPRPLRKYMNPEAAAVEDQVLSVVQNSIREVFGGNPTQQEGEGLMKRAFDPQLPEKENIKKMEVFSRELEMAHNQKLQAAKWFQEHGDMRGFKGKMYNTVQDFLREYDSKYPQRFTEEEKKEQKKSIIPKKESETSREINGVKYEKVNGGWKKVQ